MVVQELALQGSSFRGHDEFETSLNQGNLKSWIRFSARLNEEIKNVVLDKAPENAKYTSPSIQKEILAIIANRVHGMIREEIGDSCYSILVDEAVDQAGKEQMSIILRFVNSRGILTERFFALKSVPETSADTLKQVICGVLSKYNLQIDKMRGQGYDGASNMSGQFNGLRALFLRDCPYAYFVHCFAHKLQLTLVASAKVCDPIWDFFSLLDCIINIVKSS
ncbi:Zinc finger MYM-type protein 1 [Linum perenne]